MRTQLDEKQVRARLWRNVERHGSQGKVAALLGVSLSELRRSMDGGVLRPKLLKGLGLRRVVTVRYEAIGEGE